MADDKQTFHCFDSTVVLIVYNGKNIWFFCTWSELQSYIYLLHNWSKMRSHTSILYCLVCDNSTHGIMNICNNHNNSYPSTTPENEKHQLAFFMWHCREPQRACADVHRNIDKSAGLKRHKLLDTCRRVTQAGFSSSQVYRPAIDINITKDKGKSI